jgi:hypothetical protein
MVKSNLVELVRTFSPREIKEFGEYLVSPFFNKNEGIIKLYDYIRKYYPDFDEKKMEKEFVFSKIFPNAAYNDGFMRTLMFNLNKLAEDFLTYREFASDSFTQEKYLLESYNRRRLDKQFGRKLKTVYDNLEKSSDTKDEMYFYRKYSLERILNRFDAVRMDSLLKMQHGRLGDTGNESENLIRYFILALMRRYREVLNKKYIYNIDYNLKLIDELVNHLHTHKYDDIPLIEFYFRFIQLMEGIDKEKNYLFVKDFLMKNHPIFSKPEGYALFIGLCNVAGKEKVHNWEKELFVLYKFILENDLYSNDGLGKITFIEFISIIFVGLRLQEYDWVENFVDKFKHKLDESEKQNAANYGYARLNFERGNYSKANEYLSKVHFEALYYKIWVKGLQIRIFYEMGWLDEALSQIDSFRHFLSSNAMITKHVAKLNSVFIKMTKRLIAARTYMQKKDIAALRQDVEKDKDINSREWLIRKINELEKKAG